MKIFFDLNKFNEAIEAAQPIGLAVKECPWGNALSKLSPKKLLNILLVVIVKDKGVERAYLGVWLWLNL